MDEVILSQVASEYVRFPSQLLFYRLLHTHHHLLVSSGAGTIVQIVTCMPMDSVSHQSNLDSSVLSRSHCRAIAAVCYISPFVMIPSVHDSQLERRHFERH